MVGSDFDNCSVGEAGFRDKTTASVSATLRASQADEELLSDKRASRQASARHLAHYLIPTRTMPLYREGEPKPGWMRRREWIERSCHKIFGQDAETMCGVFFILAGGILIGMAIVASARAGWDLGILGGSALAILPAGVGIKMLPQRRDD